MSQTKINLRGYIRNPGLFARVVWQKLFDTYRNGCGDLTNMDSLLCDLGILERAFSGERAPNEDPIEPGFQLGFDFGGSSTELCDAKDCPSPLLIIEWDGGHIVTITDWGRKPWPLA